MTGNWSITEPRTIEFDGVRELKLATIAGRFDILAHDDGVVRLDVREISGEPLTVSYDDDGRLAVRHGVADDSLLGFQHLSTVVLTLSVPAGTRVEASTISGDGLVSGLAASTTVSSVSGSVLADATRGELHASTVSGEAIVRNHEGALALNSVKGEVTASGSFTAVKANTVTGDLSLDVLNRPERIATNSVSGSVLIRLPAETAVALRVSSLAGRVSVNDGRLSVVGTSAGRYGDSGWPEVPVACVSVSGGVSVVVPPSGPAAAPDGPEGPEGGI
jgi:hypothetical protein